MTVSDPENLTRLDDGYVRFRFRGNFEGKEIVWDAHLYTLAYYVYKVAKFSRPAPPIQQFIHVGGMGKKGRRIEIGLNLPEIDNGAVMKTMIMIRQYKRLVAGRHDYGETVQIED